jgi:protein-tyrosine phosphatase
MKRGSCNAGETGGTIALSLSPWMESCRRKLGDEDFANDVPVVESLRNISGDIRAGNASNRVCLTRRKVVMDITWLTDRIAVGGGIWNADNMAAVSRAGITHIIDMQIEFDDTPLAEPHAITVCWNPVDDDFEPKHPEVFARGVEFALGALKQPEAKVFIHCAAGVHRAPMMALALLGVMGWKLEDAMDLIEAKRPAADFAEVYVQSVEKFLNARS